MHLTYFNQYIFRNELTCFEEEEQEKAKDVAKKIKR